MSKQRLGSGPVLVAWFIQNNVIFLTGGVVAIICLMVLPLPEFVLDTLIAVNMASSIGLLLLTMYVSSPLALNTFPTLLLFTTLLRLSLNIASSRSILLHAEAGHIIETFGRLVVGGNVVVGLVIFMIISIVQFIVVAKGSERVAEVAARFTLDAMPGKQMSIDADLRAGMIDKDEAKRRRTLIEQESQLNGAMDGAMKFVKGDAIAGLLIALVNLLAGFAVGAGMHGMSIGEAIDRYAILSVGDGMVSQIPSLFVSIAAGVLTTRVSGNDASSLGGEIVRQMLGQPTALLVTGAILLGFLLVPGFPVLQFLFLGLAVGGIGMVLHRQARRDRTGRQAPVPAMQGEGEICAPPNLVEESLPPFSVPLLVRVSDAMSADLDAERFSLALEGLREQLRERLGLPFPGVRLVRDASLEAGSYRILVHDVLVVDANMPVGKCAIHLDADAGLPEGFVLDRSLEALGRIAWGGFGGELPRGASALHADTLLVLYLRMVIFSRPHEFLGLQEVQRMLQRAERELFELIKELIKTLPLQRITDVLRRLLREGVPVRNLRAIGEGLVAWGGKEKDLVMLTELVRIELGRWIAGTHAHGTGTIRAVLIHPDTEASFKRSIQQNASGSFLALSAEDTKRFCGELEKLLQSGGSGALRPVLVTSMDLRRYARRLIETALPETAVLSFEEIGSHAGLSVCGTVSL
jgi:type III secretion protein V